VSRRTVALLAAALAVTLTATASALAGNGGIAPPDPVTTSAGAIRDLYWLVIGITGVIFVLVEGALVLFIVKYRRRRGAADGDGPQIHGNTRLELIWTAIPLLILASIVAVTIIMVPEVNAEEGASSDPLVVHVVGHQFYWEYTYPNGVVSVDTLRLPVDRPVRLVLNGSDVVHSWWVPQITGKRDAIPGKTNTLDFTPLDVGTFRGQCAELCGVQHAVMYTRVEVIPQADYDSWIARQAVEQPDPTSPGGLALGQQTWEGVCAKCHGLDGKGSYGPSIAGNSLLGDEQGLVQLLNKGQNQDNLTGYMPAVGEGWPADQVRALLAYLKKAGLGPAQTQAQQGG